jgi:hypothetical protein
MRWAGDVAHMGETRNAYKVLVPSQGYRTPQGALIDVYGLMVGW